MYTYFLLLLFRNFRIFVVWDHIYLPLDQSARRAYLKGTRCISRVQSTQESSITGTAMADGGGVLINILGQECARVGRSDRGKSLSSMSAQATGLLGGKSKAPSACVEP